MPAEVNRDEVSRVGVPLLVVRVIALCALVGETQGFQYFDDVAVLKRWVFFRHSAQEGAWRFSKKVPNRRAAG